MFEVPRWITEEITGGITGWIAGWITYKLAWAQTLRPAIAISVVDQCSVS